MKIEITDDYVMTSDAHNFVLNTPEIILRGPNKGKIRLRPVGYYQSVQDLVDGLISKKMMQSTKRTLKGFIQEHADLIAEIRRIFRAGLAAIDYGNKPCPECGESKKLRKA